jgi:hypothetical protein
MILNDIGTVVFLMSLSANVVLGCTVMIWTLEDKLKK